MEEAKVALSWPAATILRHGSRPRTTRSPNRIRDWVDAHCWSDVKQSYTMHPGTDRLDPSLLLATRFGFERSDRLVFRCSGMAAKEGTFLDCAFWMVEAFALLGEHGAAVQQADALLAATSGNLGLLHGQMDPGTGAMLGNMP